MYSLRRLLHACLFALLCFQSARNSAVAQQTINNGSIAGSVRDSSGAVMEGAHVQVRLTATNLVNTTLTGHDGSFRFPYLPVGHYELTVRRSGFREVRRELELTLGAVFDLSFTMPVASAESTVTVDAAGPVLETRRSQIAATILQPEIAALPFNGRNFLDLALLMPGVSPTNTAATQLFAETSAVAGQGISVSSQRNFSNSFIVDGLSTNDDAAGLVQTSYGLDVIREMQVVTNGAQAEFGRALGGYINFVSNSGCNKMHGAAYGYLRNQRLNAENALARTTLPVTQAQYGASLSGPVRRDRTFFFSNVEQLRLNQSGLVSVSAANANAIDAKLQSTGYQGPLLAISPGAPATPYSNPVHTTTFFAKIDHNWSDHDLFVVRYSLYHAVSENSRGVGGINSPSAGAALADLDQTIAVSNIATISPRMVNETRGQFVRSNLEAPANDATGPAVSISGAAAFGTLSSSPTARFDRLYELVDTLSRQSGAHSLRAGGDLLFNDLRITFPQSSRGSYAFPSLANFLAGRYSTFTQSFGKDTIPQHNPNVGLFAQDEWKVSRGVTLNAGVRYDLQYLKTIAIDTNNVSPRAGVAWSPFREGKTLVRASYGLFYDRVPLRALSNAIQSNGNTTTINDSTFVNLSLSYGQSGAPTFPQIASGYTATNLPGNVKISLSTMDPHLRNAYAGQASLEVEQQLTSTSTLGVSYQHVQSERLLLSINRNTPTCSSAVDPVNLCRPNLAYSNNKQYSSQGGGRYDALAVSYVKRTSGWGSYRVAYTWSKAIDDVGEFFFSSPINNFDVGADRSRSDDDQRHRVVVDATVHTSTAPATGWHERVLHGFLLSGVLQYYSALPFNVVTGGNTLQTTSQRPCTTGFSLLANGGVNGCTQALRGAVISRNAGVGFDFVNLNLRVSRSYPLGEHVRLESIAEAFNAFNHRNDEIPNAVFGGGTYPQSPSATFRQATAVADPRNVQLALRLSF